MTTPPVAPTSASNVSTTTPQQYSTLSTEPIQAVAQQVFQEPWTDDQWDEYFRVYGIPDAPAPETRPRRILEDDENLTKMSDTHPDPDVLVLDTNEEAPAPVLTRLKRHSEKPAGTENPFDRIQKTPGKKRRTTVVKQGKIADVEAEEEISGEAVQQMSIRRIALSRILKTCPPKGAVREQGLSAIKQISRLAKRMIETFNKKMEKEGKREYCFQRVKFDSASFQEKWNPAERQGFHLKVYTRTISTFSKLAQALEELGAQAQNPRKEVQQELTSCRVDTILLFYREEKQSQKKDVPGGTLFALPTGEGWSATEECTDWKFSRNVAKRCLTSEINSYAYRGLVGNNLSDDVILKQSEVLPRTRTYDKLITSFRARLKPDSSLYQLPFFQTRQRKPPQRGINLSAEMGCVHPCKQMSLMQIAQLLDHLSHIAKGETTYKTVLDSNGKIDAYPLKKIPEEDGTNFWDDIILAGQKEAKKLRSALLNEVWLCFKGVREICLDFYHKHVNDYCNAGKYELYYRKRPLTSWSTPKSAQEMIQLVRQQCPTLSQCQTVEQFQDELNHVVVKFNTAGTIKEDTFANYFEGEVRCKSKVFFKVGNQWYRISTDYTKWVEVEFQSLLKRCFVPKELLPKCWPERPVSQKEERFYAEGIYNRSYANTQGYLLGDKITPDGVELFDLAHYCQKSGKLYLIAVKSGFGRTTREACAQIRDSSEKLHPELIGEAKQSILDQLIARIKQRDSHKDSFAPWGGEEAFKKLFIKLYREKKIVFTYAFADSAKKERQLVDEIALTVQFSPSHFSQIAMDPGTILNSLKKMGYLDDKGALTSQFLSTTKKAFLEAEGLPATKTVKGQIYDQLYRKGSSKFDSTIARLELLNLEKDLQSKGFSLAICQIARTPQTSSTPTEEELPGLLRLEAMPQVDEIDFCEGDAFEHQGATYRIDRTEADGACGLHAALGTEVNGIFICPAGGPAARQELVEKLQKMKQEEFLELAQEHLTNLIQEYDRLRDKCNPSTLLLFQQAEIKRLFLQYAKKREELSPDEMQAKEELWNSFQTFFSSLSKNDAKAVELHKILTGTSGMDLATFQKSEGLLKKAFEENIQTMKDWIEQHIRLDHPLRRALGKIKGIQSELDEALESLIQNPRFIQGYFKALAIPKYWLFSDELGFVAKLYKRNLSLYHQRQGRVELAVDYPSGDSDAPIARIFHEQVGEYAHFSHISQIS